MKNLELRQIRYFIALAEELNFTKAAKRLHISQPPLSAQIAQLESDLGVKLFHRTSRKVSLTNAGTIYLRDVRRIQWELNEAAERAHNVHAGLAGRIDIGLSGSHFLGPLPRLIHDVESMHNDIEVVLNEMAPNKQIDALHQQRIDISISRQSINNDFLSSHLLWTDPLMIALPGHHHLLTHETLDLQDLANEAFIMLRRETSHFADQVFMACEVHGFHPHVVHNVAEVPAQLSLVNAGLGIAIVPESTTAYQADTLSFRPLNEKSLHADVYAVVRRDHLKSVIKTFLEVMRSR